MCVCRFDAEVIPYKPIFQDGWSPGVVHIPDDDDDAAADFFYHEHAAAENGFGERRGPTNSSGRSQMYREPVSPAGSGVGGGEEVLFRAPVGGSHDDYRDSLMAKNSKIALVAFSREKQHFRELTVIKGEYLEVLDDTKKWWHCRNSSSEAGFVPHTLVKALIYSDVMSSYA